MSTTADATLEARDPDSPDVEGEEPTEDWDAPLSPDEGTAEVPEASSAAADAEAAGQPDPVVAAPDGAPAGPARDAQGRFVPAAEPTGKVEPVVTSPPIADAPPPEPFGFRVDGVPVSVDGATVVGDEIRIPRTAWERVVTPRLADRGKVQQQFARQNALIESLKTERSAKEQRAEAILSRMDELLDDPAKLMAFAKNYESEAPRLKLEIENKILRSETEQRTKRAESDGARDLNDRLAQNARPAIESAVKLALDETAKDLGIDPKEAADFVHSLWEAGVPVFFRVQPGDGSGLDPADDPIGVDLPRVAKLLEPMIGQAKKTAATKKAAEVAQANARVLQPKGPKPPATVPTKGSPTPGGEERTFKNADEFNDYLRGKYKIPI